MDIINKCYQYISMGDSDIKRTQEFLKNNSYQEIKEAVMNRIQFNDANGDGKLTLEDFLMKLKNRPGK